MLRSLLLLALLLAGALPVSAQHRQPRRKLLPPVASAGRAAEDAAGRAASEAARRAAEEAAARAIAGALVETARSRLVERGAADSATFALGRPTSFVELVRGREAPAEPLNLECVWRPQWRPSPWC